jgi:hypothetical protein
MVCKACASKRRTLSEEDFDIMGGYKYLPDKQIKARLAIFKKRFCKDCDQRYTCDYSNYLKCKKS